MWVIIFEPWFFIRFVQIYVWVGCNTAKFGHLYAAATTRPVSGNCFILRRWCSVVSLSFFFGSVASWRLMFQCQFFYVAFSWPLQDNGVSVTSVLGGTSDNTGSGIARRLGTASVFSYSLQTVLLGVRSLNPITKRPTKRFNCRPFTLSWPCLDALWFLDWLATA